MAFHYSLYLLSPSNLPSFFCNLTHTHTHTLTSSFAFPLSFSYLPPSFLLLSLFLSYTHKHSHLPPLFTLPPPPFHPLPYLITHVSPFLPLTLSLPLSHTCLHCTSLSGEEGVGGSCPPLEGAVDGQVCTRFPPEPSGYLHIGTVSYHTVSYFSPFSSCFLHVPFLFCSLSSSFSVLISYFVFPHFLSSAFSPFLSSVFFSPYY